MKHTEKNLRASAVTVRRSYSRVTHTIWDLDRNQMSEKQKELLIEVNTQRWQLKEKIDALYASLIGEAVMKELK